MSDQDVTGETGAGAELREQIRLTRSLAAEMRREAQERREQAERRRLREARPARLEAGHRRAEEADGVPEGGGRLP